jgi:SAM-dependent methyltransferase
LSDDRQFEQLVRRAADRYVGTSITAWEFARGKLRHDPVYRAAVYDGLLTPPAPRHTDGQAGWTLADVGCGQGLMLALLAEARRDVRAGDWASPPEPPRFDRMLGIETRPRVARIAQTALGEDAEILTADARAAGLPRAHAALLFDVLHLMNAADQEALLEAVVRSLEPGGVIVVREADASAGWRFAAVRMGNRIKALAIGHWGQPFHFRSASEWVACFARMGLVAESHQMGQGTPFGNVLFRLTATEVATHPGEGGDPAPMNPLAPAG